ncbi:MAG TPA: plastocyanin/azurin family copper-binding protein [Acidimicrobiales bacterium]|nr:plastocyanin/azurin family copper-binding protein [Acidimicrobiales bacterium]
MHRALSLVGTGLLAATLTLAAACGEDDNADDGSELEDVVSIDGSEADVKVLDNTFNDENISVASGTKVVWTNDGRQDHDIIPNDDGDWGVDPDDFEAGAVYEHTFDEPGTYRYYCSLHGSETSGMIGAVVVEEP